MALEISQGSIWRALFDEHRSELLEVAEILLYRHGSPESILKMALAELDGKPFDESFGGVTAARAVVKAAIAHTYTDIDSWIITTSSGTIDEEYPAILPLKTLPWAERAAYFLRDVLHYSRRDCARLLMISDANVDELDRFANKRMGIPVEGLPQSRLRHTRPTQAACSAHSMAFSAFE